MPLETGPFSRTSRALRPLGVGVALVLGLVVASSCAQIEGLDHFSAVECLDDCDQGSTQATPPAPPTTARAPVDAAPPVDSGGASCGDVTSSKANCGACGHACASGEACCAGVCINVDSDAKNCGGCGRGCGSSERCGQGSCGISLVGDGADGPLAPTSDVVVNPLSTGGASGAAGQKAITVGDPSGFEPDDIVFLHQTRGSGAGAFELAIVASIDVSAKKLVLRDGLVKAYASDGDNRAQVVRVQRFSTVGIPSGVTVRAPAWDGDKGGILVMMATGTVNVAGAIDMTGGGFRAYSHASECDQGIAYRCTDADTADGFAGESSAASSSVGQAANGAGGGGGQDGQDCASGGGGGHGAAGADGANGSGGACHVGTQLGGAGGAVVGSADLTDAVLLGAAGGEGGGDEDGAYPGAGGNGGGIVWVNADAITVTGAIRSDGTGGADGVVTSTMCGGGGCGMGGGGGAAGGAIRLHVQKTADLGDGLVTASGGNGGACSCQGQLGGAGGSGRIGVAGAVTGTSTPALDPH